MSFDVNEWITFVNPTVYADDQWGNQEGSPMFGVRPDCPDCGEEEIVTIFWEHEFFKHDHPKKIRECVELPTWLVTMISGYANSNWETHEGLVARMGEVAEGPAAGIWQFCKMQSSSDDWGEFSVLPDRPFVGVGDKVHVQMSLPGTEDTGRFEFALCYELVLKTEMAQTTYGEQVSSQYFDLKLVDCDKED